MIAGQQRVKLPNDWYIVKGALIKKIAVGCEQRTKIEGCLCKNKMGDFSPWRTLPYLYFIIPESLVVPCAVVLHESQGNRQTNKQTELYDQLGAKSKSKALRSE